MKRYDKIIIGAGLYGLYSALFCGKNKEKILVLECDLTPFRRATYINQARVHHGYHYPRSIATAMKSAGYFARFNKDYDFCINKEFKKIYATSSQYSWSDGEQFKKFCKAANIPCEELHPEGFFKEGMCDGAFLTKEYTYDAVILRDYLVEKLEPLRNVEIRYGINIKAIGKLQDEYAIYTDKDEYRTEFLLNATYAGTNQILDMVGYEKFGIKYELCEIILCDVNKNLQQYGFTVMDGPFFSIMPFGKTCMHSLTSVTFTPHMTSYDSVPTFDCQERSGGFCSTFRLGNCNDCPVKPETAFPYMANLARKYLKDEFKFTYRLSLFSMKPILVASELDDSRPTVIRVYSKNPTFVGVLSGKINTVYDLEEVLSVGGRVKEKNFVSAIIYVHNAEERVEKFLEMVIGMLENNFENSEVICVNDDSVDDSRDIIEAVNKRFSTSISVVNMSYFHGLEVAMSAGIDLSIGDFVFEFDNTVLDFSESDVMNIYWKALTGYDIVSASTDKPEKFMSKLFYRIYERHSKNSRGKMKTESFRILSRRVINRINHMNKTVPYRKAVYAYSGLKSENILYKSLETGAYRAEKQERKYKKGLAIDSLLIFTDIGYKLSMVMSFLMLFITGLIIVYTIIAYAVSTPVEGWTSTILFLAVAFFGLFMILTIIIKYLQLLLEMVFKRHQYSYESIEKLTKYERHAK